MIKEGDIVLIKFKRSALAKEYDGTVQKVYKVFQVTYEPPGTLGFSLYKDDKGAWEDEAVILNNLCNLEKILWDV